ncbi:unnamed protein product [Urochloa humidicola]
MMKYPRLLAVSIRLLLLCLLAVLVLAAADVPPEHRPGCKTRCGGVDIPYPFGIGDQCAIHPGFGIDCTSVNGTETPFSGDFEVTKISVPDAKAWMKMGISRQCYDRQARQVNWTTWQQNFTDTPFRFSYVDNKIFVVGCNTLAYLISESYSIGCLSKCSDQEPINGSCSVGAGCCQVDVPHDLGYLEAYFNENYTTTGCGYIVVMEEEAFSYSTTYRDSSKFWDAYKGKVPVVMDWTITQYTCEEAKMDLSSYACVSDKSECVNTTNGAGSRCKCQDGYQGNPYVKDGCTDIDECLQNTTDSCTHSGGTCRNTQGSFTCKCPRGKQMINDMCMENQKSSWVIPVVGSSVGLVVLIVTTR